MSPRWPPGDHEVGLALADALGAPGAIGPGGGGPRGRRDGRNDAGTIPGADRGAAGGAGRRLTAG